MQVGFFFRQTVISHRYVTRILTPFSEKLSDCERTYTFLQQDSTTLQTILCTVKQVFW